MNQNGIMFSLVAVPDEIAGGKKVYRAYVKTNGTIDKEALAKALAEKTGQDTSLASYFLDALNEILAKEIVAGYRVNLGQLSTGFSIKGSFTSEDDRFDPKRHAVNPTIQALDPLKSALAAVGADNITVGLVCRVGSLMDFVTKGLNEITGSNEVHIEGENLGIDTENADEHVTLVKDDGSVAAVATVTVTLLEDIPATEPPHYPATSKDGTTTVTGFCNNAGEEVEFITDGIVDFTGTGLGRITTNGEWRESSDAEWKQALIGMPPEEGEPLGYALQGQAEPGEYPNAEFKLPHPSGDMIVPLGYKYES